MVMMKTRIKAIILILAIILNAFRELFPLSARWMITLYVGAVLGWLIGKYACFQYYLDLGKNYDD